jgi:hypothetical protein
MFDCRHYLTLWEVVGLERGPLSLVSTIEELRGRKSSVSSLGNQEYGRRDPWRWPRRTLYPQKLALTSPISGGLSVGIVRSRTEPTEFVLVFGFFVPKRIKLSVPHLLNHDLYVVKRRCTYYRLYSIECCGNIVMNRQLPVSDWRKYGKNN